MMVKEQLSVLLGAKADVIAVDQVKTKLFQLEDDSKDYVTEEEMVVVEDGTEGGSEDGSEDGTETDAEKEARKGTRRPMNLF